MYSVYISECNVPVLVNIWRLVHIWNINVRTCSRSYLGFTRLIPWSTSKLQSKYLLARTRAVSQLFFLSSVQVGYNNPSTEMIRLRGWNAQGIHCIFYDSNFCYFNVITCNYRGVSMKLCNVMSLFPFFIVCGISFTTIRHSIQCVSSHPSHCFLCHARSNCCPSSILF